MLLNITQLRDFVSSLMTTMFDRNSEIRAFHLEGEIDRGVYIRHLIEAVNRIHLNNEVAT